MSLVFFLGNRGQSEDVRKAGAGGTGLMACRVRSPNLVIQYDSDAGVLVLDGFWTAVDEIVLGNHQVVMCRVTWVMMFTVIGLQMSET